MTRRFPAPWSFRELDQAFVVSDANGSPVVGSSCVAVGRLPLPLRNARTGVGYRSQGGREPLNRRVRLVPWLSNRSGTMFPLTAPRLPRSGHLSAASEHKRPPGGGPCSRPVASGATMALGQRRRHIRLAALAAPPRGHLSTDVLPDAASGEPVTARIGHVGHKHRGGKPRPSMVKDSAYIAAGYVVLIATVLIIGFLIGLY